MIVPDLQSWNRTVRVPSCTCVVDRNATRVVELSGRSAEADERGSEFVISQAGCRAEEGRGEQ